MVSRVRKSGQSFRSILIFIVLSAITALVSCQKDEEGTDNSSGNDSVILNEEASDYIYNISDACSIDLNGNSISSKCTGASKRDSPYPNISRNIQPQRHTE
jgi:hypothetical protein